MLIIAAVSIETKKKPNLRKESKIELNGYFIKTVNRTRQDRTSEVEKINKYSLI